MDRSYAEYRTPSGIASAVFHGGLPYSLTNKDAKRNERVLRVVEIPADDPRTDGEILTCQRNLKARDRAGEPV